MEWDPDNYLRFGDERARPFFDLVNRIHLAQAATVVDLGCGPGTLTATLAQRWPTARVLGIDSSPQMIHRASVLATERVGFALGDLGAWEPAERVDVIVSNAALQWVPDHATLYPALVAKLAPGGSLAVQTPDNLEEPAHRLARQVAGEAPWAAKTGGVKHPPRHSAAWYYELLKPHCGTLDESR